MRQHKIALLVTLLILFLVSGCTKTSQPLSAEVRNKTKKDSSYKIVRKIVGTTAEIFSNDIQQTDSGTFIAPNPTYFLTTWLRLENRTPIKTAVTIDCRIFKNGGTPNKPINSVVRKITLEPWEVKTEPFTGMESVWNLKVLNSWCGLQEVEYP